MGKDDIILYGGSFNPAGLHHRDAVRALATDHRVIVVPCGPRPEKLSTNDIEPIHRAAMADMTFGTLPNVEVDLFDLENNVFTRTHALDEKYRRAGVVWHAIGAEFIKGGGRGASFIQTAWERGQELWQSLRFVIMQQPGETIDPADLPPQRMIVPVPRSGSSTLIRDRVSHHAPLDDFVDPAVGTYIERHHLYRGIRYDRRATFRIDEPRPHVLFDENNERARRLAECIPSFPLAKANFIVGIGGDGTLLHILQQTWRSRLPVFGINAGRRGHLMNDLPPADLDRLSLDLFRNEFDCYHTPFLYAEAVTEDGATKSMLGVNDAWVQAQPGSAVFLEVGIDGRIVLPQVVADGMLVATPVGSTAYALAMGATPVLVDAPVPTLTLVGSNVFEPQGFRPVHVRLTSTVDFRSLDPTPQPRKRPMLGFVDGVPLGPVTSMHVRASRTAAAELLFFPETNLTNKLFAKQFPYANTSPETGGRVVGKEGI